MYNARNYAVSPRTFGGMLEGMFNKDWNHFNDFGSMTVPVNIHESDKSYDIHVVAPGMKKEDLKIDVDNNTLHISAEHKEETTEKQEGKWLRNEYRVKSFKRSFTLNEKIDTAKITAKYNDGVLVVSLPKKENSEPASQHIAVN
jgi:HSP20 family protein